MLPKLFRALLGKLEIEFLISLLFLIPAVPNAAVAIEARPAPACSAKSSPALLAALFTPFEIASDILDSGFESGVCDGVSSVFYLLLLFLVRYYIYLHYYY